MSKELTKRILSSIVLIPIVFFFILKGSVLFNFFLLICFFIAVFEWHMMSKRKFYHIIGIIFLIFSFYSIYKLRNNFENEYICLLFLTIICVSTDIGGYIFGKFFQGPKLTKISPKKTYSGLIGGYLFSTTAVIFLINSKYFELLINYNNYDIFFFTILVSTISQLGDIIISLFKRLSMIKDTGKIIPGHGGLLDRIDGMIFAFPFSYIMFSLKMFNFF